MDVFLRRYFWVWLLFTIAICALFAARGVNSVIVAKLAGLAAKSATATTTSMVRPEAPAATRDLRAVLARNIFCSTCEPELPVEETDAESGPASGEPAKSPLALNLIATLVCLENPAWSFAAILDRGSDQTGLYSVGSDLPGQAVVVDILTRKVIVQRGSRLEYLDLMDQTRVPNDVPPPQPSPSRGGKKAFLPDDIRQGVRKTGDKTWEIQKSALEKVLSNTTMLARSARVVPSTKDGKPNGFKLYAIRPGSMYDLIGLKNGDTVHSINGLEMSTPDKALEVYTRVRNASHLTINFTRGSDPVTHDYDIR